MFIENMYLNERLISEVTYKVNFDSTEYSVHDYKHNIYLYNPHNSLMKLGNKNFHNNYDEKMQLISNNDVGSINTAINEYESRLKRDPGDDYYTRQVASFKLRLKKLLAIRDEQNLIIGKPSKGVVKNHRGYITIYITMSNSNVHTFDVLHWKYYETYEDGKVKEQDVIEKLYNEDVDINFIMNFINNGSPKKDREKVKITLPPAN